MENKIEIVPDPDYILNKIIERGNGLPEPTDPFAKAREPKCVELSQDEFKEFLVYCSSRDAFGSSNSKTGKYYCYGFEIVDKDLVNA